MNSFKMTAIGNLARNPEVIVEEDRSFTRFCLVGSDSVKQDDGEDSVRHFSTSIWFVAFGEIGKAIAKEARKVGGS